MLDALTGKEIATQAWRSDFEFQDTQEGGR